MAMHPVLDKDVNKKIFLLGNEAIVRGALEAGLDVAAAYPGTPSSEIGNTFDKMGDDAGVYFEYSTNEKVAMEVAAAGSACNLRAMTFMKHVGLNVAADAYMTIAYTGVRGGMLMVCADDPSCHSSQNEQDNRYYARLANIPMLEPSSCSEAKEMTRLGFDLSEEIELPILLRTTTRINHMRGIVNLGPLVPGKGKGYFDKDPGRFVTIPAHARTGHINLLKRMEKAMEISENSPFNKVIDLGGDEIGIVASGAAYNYVIDYMKSNGIKGKVLKLGMSHPVPEKMCADFMASVKMVAVAEEGEPLLENDLSKIAYQRELKVKIYGKNTDHFSRRNEYSPDTIKAGLGKLLNIPVNDNKLVPRKVELPTRPPSLCPGCPHRHTYHALKKALGQKFKEAIYSTDIGCYTLGIQSPLNSADFLLCMGSSVDAAGGFSKATDQPALAFLGDSTFFHSGIHGLINAVWNEHKFVYTILDNRTTAMTGHQPNPGMGRRGGGAPSKGSDIESIVRGCGVEFVRVVDPNDIKATTQVYKEALAYDGLAVVITKRACALLEVREWKKEGSFTPYQVDQEKCKKCKVCINTFACPAIELDNEGVVSINEEYCNGCSVCVQVCPFGAIGPVNDTGVKQ